MIHAIKGQEEALHLPTLPRVAPPVEVTVGPAMLYVSKPLIWEYKQMVRDLAKEEMLGEAELNQLGAEGWELSGVVATAAAAFFYFKRAVD